MLWGSSKHWLVSPSPAHRQLPTSGPGPAVRAGGIPGTVLGSRVASPALSRCLCQWSCSAGRTQLLLTKGLTCLCPTPHVSQKGRCWEGWILHPIALSPFLAHRGPHFWPTAEGCQVWVQDVPDCRQCGMKEIQVGQTSLGWSGVKGEWIPGILHPRGQAGSGRCVMCQSLPEHQVGAVSSFLG